jgi:hypothetical protein
MVQLPAAECTNGQVHGRARDRPCVREKRYGRSVGNALVAQPDADRAMRDVHNPPSKWHWLFITATNTVRRIEENHR